MASIIAYLKEILMIIQFVVYGKSNQNKEKKKSEIGYFQHNTFPGNAIHANFLTRGTF